MTQIQMRIQTRRQRTESVGRTAACGPPARRQPPAPRSIIAAPVWNRFIRHMDRVKLYFPGKPLLCKIFLPC